MRRGIPRGRGRSRGGHRGGRDIDPEGKNMGMAAHPIQQRRRLSSLEQFTTPNLRQGDRKRNQRKNNADGGVVGGGANPDISSGIDREVRFGDVPSLCSQTSLQLPQKSPTQLPQLPTTTPFKLLSTTFGVSNQQEDFFNYFGHRSPLLSIQQISPLRPHLNPDTTSTTQPSIGLRDRTSSTADSEPVQGLNDYRDLLTSREKQQEMKKSVMASLENVFEVQEWEPELPPRSDPDASPERLSNKPEPLTYTTVGSVVKPTDARQFTAPNRIQREGRIGLEVGGRRPVLGMANPPRGSEFFSSRPQFPQSQSYLQGPTHGFIPEPQRGRPGYASAQPSAENHTSSPAGRPDLLRGRSSTSDHAFPQYGAQPHSQDQAPHPTYPQDHSSTSQATVNKTSAAVVHQSQLARQYMLEHSMGAIDLTPEEADVLARLRQLRLGSVSGREEKQATSIGNSYQHELHPNQQRMLASLQERSANVPRTTVENDDATGFQPDLAMNYDSNLSASGSNNAARLQDAKMSTVQSLAQYPNPHQEHAKARLAELAASKMRGYNENQRPGQFDHNMDSEYHQIAQMKNEGRGSEASMPSKHRDPYMDELDSFRFPPHRTQMPVYNFESFKPYESAVNLPRKTPQGYPQPLTAGPPGQRQNAGPSSNQALNSMQQMLMHHNQRVGGTSQQYSLTQQSIHTPTIQPSLAPPTLDQHHFGTNAIIPDPELYPWKRMDQQRRSDGPPPRVRETLSFEDAKKYYPNGMDNDTFSSFMTTLSPEEALKHYPGGMDEGTAKWYEEGRKFQQEQSDLPDLGSLLDGSIPYSQWIRGHRTGPKFNTFDTQSGGGVGRSANEYRSQEKPNESGGPGVIGQSRQIPASKRFTLAEINAMSFPEATEAFLCGNALANLLKYKEKSPANAAMLKARGFAEILDHAIDIRPNGNGSSFDSALAHVAPQLGSSRANASSEDSSFGPSGGALLR